MSIILPLNFDSWNPSTDSENENALTEALEQGKLIYLPKLAFPIGADKQYFLDPALLAKGRKNISFNKATQSLKGAATEQSAAALSTLMQDFVEKSESLVGQLLPHYKGQLITGRTSFRPASIEKRKSSNSKDDTLLHVDAFPSQPLSGWRILRVFSNVNPAGMPRRWHLGESFDEVIAQFAKPIRRPFPGKHWVMKAFGITKQKRSLYDHYMLNMHNNMKSDDKYQKKAIQHTIDFPPNTTWLVFTDQVSHAALSGQHLLEQTFYLPPEMQLHPEHSPLQKLERYLECELRG